MNKRVLVPVTVAILLLSDSIGLGQEPIKLSEPKIGKIACLTPVTAPSARCIAIGETAAGWHLATTRLLPTPMSR